LVAGFVQDKIAPETTLDRNDLLNIQTGITDVAEKVTVVVDVAQVQNDLQDFSQENPNLVEGSVSDLIEEIPSSNWGEARWGGFNWG
jgi:hypothetical protein